MLNRWPIIPGAFLLSTCVFLSEAVASSELSMLAAKGDSQTKEWIIAAVFVVGCLVLAFKPAKRSNRK